MIWSPVNLIMARADGIHLKVRLTQDKVCLLVMIGVRPDGRKELIALADGPANRPSPGPTCSEAASAERDTETAPGEEAA